MVPPWQSAAILQVAWSETESHFAAERQVRVFCDCAQHDRHDRVQPMHRSLEVGRGNDTCEPRVHARLGGGMCVPSGR